MKKISEKTKTFAILTIIAMVSFLTGCATIFNGSQQTVDVVSTPTQANVIVNGKDIGEAPNKITLERGKEYTIEIKKDGYSKYIVTTGRNVNSNYWLNFLNGVGFLVDWISGSMWEVEPTEVNATLEQDTGSNQILRHDDFAAINVLNKDGKLIDRIAVEWK